MQKEIDLELMCDLTDEDVQQRAQELGAAIEEQYRVQGEKADAMKEFTDQLKEIGERLRKISRAIRTRSESRIVKCVVQFHKPSPEFKRIARLDTGELVRDEPMTAEERQRHLFEPPTEEA